LGNKQIGVMIEQGPQSWSILQQKDGYASIELSGVWAIGTEATEAQAYARVVREDSAETVIPWTKAKMSVGQAWSIRLERVPAGGLYRIETSLQVNGDQALEWATRGDMIHHVGVGDLWVIAGQSNAAGYGKGPVNDPPELGIHLFRNSGSWDLATHPFNESTNTRHIENREGANPGHSPFLAFARIVKRETGWPVGLVQTALGGSPLRAWNPEEEGTLYRNMLNIVQAAGGSVRGVVWYQGCSDCNPDERDSYADRFGAMVKHWRRDVGDAELPFMTVQLNRHTMLGTTDDDNRSWGIVREQQRIAARSIPRMTLIPAIDCPLSDEIHNSPAGNLLIGERMARAALATVYAKEVHYRAPEISQIRIWTDADGETKLELEFDHVAGYLVSIGPTQPVFALEDEEGVVVVSQWQISGRNTIVLTCGRSIKGQAYVHGGSERNPAAFFPLDSLTYMPLLAFYNVPVR
jgi:sialate O-acetylesterase